MTLGKQEPSPTISNTSDSSVHSLQTHISKDTFRQYKSMMVIVGSFLLSLTLDTHTVQAGGAGQHNLVSSLSSDANHMWAAVEFEKRSGFQNSKGKVHFDVFMVGVGG